MEEYTIKEAAEELDITTRCLYGWINRVEAGTPYRFERGFRDKYFMGNPRKQLIITEGDMEKLKNLQRLMRDPKVGMKKALFQVYCSGYLAENNCE